MVENVFPVDLAGFSASSFVEAVTVVPLSFPSGALVFVTSVPGRPGRLDEVGKSAIFGGGVMVGCPALRLDWGLATNLAADAFVDDLAGGFGTTPGPRMTLGGVTLGAGAGM